MILLLKISIMGIIMAIYSFSRKITKRTSKDGKVKNAVFASAYYRAEKRTCHKIQETKDFTSKIGGVIYKDCLLPSDVPEWATKLRGAHVLDENGQYVYDKTGSVFSDYAWNLIENIEKRYDSQLYIRDIVAIPIELNQEQAIDLAREFTKNVLAVDGTFCEVAVHWDLVNPHVHYMRPAFRTFTEEGFSKKVRPTQAELKAELLKHRELWAEYANQKLAIAGFDVRIDYRSYKERGIDLLPTVKVGKATYMTGTEHQELRIAENQRIRAENYQKIEDSPEILVKKIGQERQSLVKEDVHQELSRYVVGEQILEKIKQEQDASREKLVQSVIEILKSDHTILNERTLKAEVLKQTDDNEAYQQIVDKVLTSEGIFSLGLGEDGRHYYVTREVFQLELEMIRGAEKLNQKSTFLVSPDDLERLSQQYTLNAGQRLALKHITQGKNIALVRGMAGTGKTYLLKPAREIWERAGYRVHGVAFLGRAAAGLESDGGINSKTIDRFLSGVRKGYIKLGNKDIIVMDEMGMTSLDHAHALVSITNAAGAKLVALGDIEQAQSTRRGASGKALIDTVGSVVLDEIIRQKVAWQAEATLNMEMQRTAQGLDAYQEHDLVAFAETRADAMTLAVQQWFDQWQVDRDELKNHVMAAFKNETVAALNLSSRERLVEKDVLDRGTEFRTASGTLLMAVGERVVFGENDYRLNVKNGYFGVIEKIDDTVLSVRLDDGTLKEFSIDQYNHINYGYAATVHKLQGYTGNYTQLYVDSRGFDRHLFLVGASRHRYNLSIITDHENFKDYGDLKEIVSREGLKDHVFDFPAAFAIRRGFDEKRITQRAAEFVRKAKEKLQDSVLWLLNYQETMERQPNKGQYTDVELRRQRARIVADFCDRRIEIAKKVEALHAMPGVSLSLGYQTLTKDEDLRDKTLSLYLENDTIHFAVRNNDGVVARMALSDEQFTSEKHLSHIKNVLYDDAQIDQLNSETKKALFHLTAQYGYTPIDEEEKIERQRDIYQSQLQNSELAREIQENYGELRVAMDRNRISREAVEKSVAFGDRHDEMKAVAQDYKLSQFYDPVQVHRIIQDFRLYYGHMISAMGGGKELNGLINELKHQAYQHRYDSVFEMLGVEMRPVIKVVKHYLDLDYEVTKILINPETSLDEMKTRLHELTVERNKLANQMLDDLEKHQSVIDHFGADQRRLEIHRVGHNASELVKRFAEMQASNLESPNLHKQLLAHKIKSRPKRYSAYINELLEDGWKHVNLENWHFERRRTLSTQSKGFKESYQLVRRYFDAALSGSEAWKSALKRRDSQSKHTAEFIRRAQGFSVQRDRLASLIVRDLEIHAGAVGFERVNLAKLTSQARSYDLMQRYLHETNEVKKLAMAHYMADNMLSFGHLAAYYHLHQDIRERAQHYRYLHLVNRAPTAEIKDFIRLNEQYEQKRYEAGQAWRLHKQLEKVGKANDDYTLYQAKHLTFQRNQAAFDLLEQAAKTQLLELRIEGVSLAAEALEKQAKQHIAYQRVLNYLNASSNKRPQLANELLSDRSCYHFIYDKGLSFKALQQESKQWLASQTVLDKQTISPERKQWDVELISGQLMANPEETYAAIFGEPKKRTGREWRYEGGLIVTIKGSDAGKWYSFTEGKGGGPIKAIQEWQNLSFKEALAYGASLAGLSESKAMTTEKIEVVRPPAHDKQKQREAKEARFKAQRIESAQSIWEGTQAIQATLAERYFVEHRKVSSLEGLEIRYWPEGSQWINYEDGKRLEKTNKIPAAVIPVRNAQGELTGVQRVYLDAKTAGKNTFMDNAKLSKGITQGSAGIIQVGQKGGRLYIAEGPETCASIALADKDATVLASLGVNNLTHMADVIRSFHPSEIILAADNDGLHSQTRKTTEKVFNELKAQLQNESIGFRLVYPQSIAGMNKVDWNDILIQQGRDAVQQGLNAVRNESTLYYHEASSIDYTPAEHYLREVKGLIGADLSEVRYHDHVMLPDQTKTQPALLIPAIDKQGNIKAELIHYLDKAGEYITQTALRGEAKGSVVAIQKTESVGSFYITDNFVDGKSIAIGNRKADVYMSLEHYQDLENISWILKRHEKVPTQVTLTTDNFEKATEKSLYELTKPLREDSISLLMAKGRVDGNYTHVSINHAMVSQDKIQGENFIQHIGIQEPKDGKLTFKEKIKQAMRAKPLEENKAEILKPEKQSAMRYYITLAKEQIDAVKAYFDSVDQLTSHDSYQNALNVAEQANCVYDSLANEIRNLNYHPQRPDRILAATAMSSIKDRALKGESLRLHDLTGLLKFVATPQLDQKTQEQLDFIVEKIAKGSYDKAYDKAIKQFSKEKSALMKAWQENKLMPSDSHQLKANDSEKLLQPHSKMDRPMFLGAIKSIEHDVAHQEQSYRKSRGRKHGDDDDRSRGGRSY